MNSKLKPAVILVIVLALAAGFASFAKEPSLYEQLGGKEKVSALATEFVQGAAKDPALADIMAKKNLDTASKKFAEALCAALGGGCPPPYTKDELFTAGSKVNPNHKKAIRASWDAALAKVGIDPKLGEAVTQTLGTKLQAITAVIH